MVTDELVVLLKSELINLLCDQAKYRALAAQVDKVEKERAYAAALNGTGYATVEDFVEKEIYPQYVDEDDLEDC